MKIKVLFFASARDAVGGKTEQWVEWNDSDDTNIASTATATTRRLRWELAAQYPGLATTMATMTDGGDDVMLHDGDTVALIPPISGG
jgi:molybdopterin converting factor small subunit